MRSNILKKLTVVLLLLGVGGVAVACDNTIRGIGRDVEETGDAVEDSAS